MFALYPQFVIVAMPTKLAWWMHAHISCRCRLLFGMVLSAYTICTSSPGGCVLLRICLTTAACLRRDLAETMPHYMSSSSPEDIQQQPMVCQSSYASYLEHHIMIKMGVYAGMFSYAANEARGMTRQASALQIYQASLVHSPQWISGSSMLTQLPAAVLTNKTCLKTHYEVPITTCSLGTHFKYSSI